MNSARQGTQEQPPRLCGRPDCGERVAFWLYHPPSDRWLPRCERHTVRRHPSLELDAWLESGYARPVEVGPPEGAPKPQDSGRITAFREMIERAMGW